MILYIQKVPYHDIYKAHSISELARALLRCLIFPRANPYVGIWVNLPLVVYGFDATVKLVLPDPIRPPDVDEKQRLDRTLLKGKLRSVTVRVKEMS